MASEISEHESWKPFYESVPVTVIVGPESSKRTFYINEDLLTRNSQYFRAALNGNFSEGQTKNFRLEEDDPSAFERFVRYLIHSPCSGTNDAPSSLFPEDFTSEQVKFYVLGDKLLAEGFKERIATDLKDFMKDEMTQMSSLLTLAKSVYQLTSKSGGATIRNVLTWYCAVGMGCPRYSTGWYSPVLMFRQWDKDEKELFLDCGLEEFQKDVLDMLCRTSGDPPEPQLAERSW